MDRATRRERCRFPPVLPARAGTPASPRDRTGYVTVERRRVGLRAPQPVSPPDVNNGTNMVPLWSSERPAPAPVTFAAN